MKSKITGSLALQSVRVYSRPLSRCSAARGLHLILLFTLFVSCAWSQSLVIKHVTVIDATGRGPQPDMTVIVDGGHIVSIGPLRKAHIPRRTPVVDGTGKFLIPGLWDMHVHGSSDDRAPWSHLLFLANGVVGVRDMSGPPDAHAWRAANVSNEDPSPTIFLGSPIIDGPNPVWPESIVVTDEAQGREVVEQQRDRGADFIKVYSRLSRNAYFAIADEANKRGISFEGHVPESVTAAEASAAGQKSIEHLTRVADGCSKEEKSIISEMRLQEALFRAPDATMAQKIDSGKSIIRLNLRVIETFDIHNTRSIEAVVLSGKLYPRAALDVMLAKAQTLVNSQDASAPGK